MRGHTVNGLAPGEVPWNTSQPLPMAKHSVMRQVTWQSKDGCGKFFSSENASIFMLPFAGRPTLKGTRAFFLTAEQRDI